MSRPSDHIESPAPAPHDGVVQPKLGPIGYVRFFWRQLTSMRTALFLLLLLAVAAAQADLDRRARSQARRLVVTEGALAGTTIGLSDTVVTPGRADDSTLVISDDYASTRHARLVPSDGSWTLEDLGSTNGTYLSGAKVVRPTPVPIGKQIRIGKTVLELRR